MQKAEMLWTFTDWGWGKLSTVAGLELLDEGTLPWLEAEGLWLLPWAEGPATFSLWCSSYSQGLGALLGPP